ncbi:MAG: glycosyltransferase [Caldilineaceae bacterium]
MSRTKAKRILFLSRWFPYPTNNGSKLRIYNLLRGLSTQHEVTLLSFADPIDAHAKSCELQSVCKEVYVVPWKPFNARGLRARLGFFNLAPRSSVDTFSPKMQQRLTHLLRSQKPDLVIASELPTLSYGAYLHGLPALFEDPELGTLYEQFANASSLWRRCRYGLTWLKLCHYLRRQLRYFQACTVVSEKERRLLVHAVPHYKTVEVVPNSIDLAHYTGIREVQQPGQLIFTGSFGYQANYDAMVWFLRDVYPLIRAKIPNVHLTITGDHAGFSLPSTENVTLTGFVDDVRPFIARAWISLAPLLSGGGTRLKILEAMALGTPVVATAKGAEGLELQPGEHLLIANTPEALAQAVIHLCQDTGLHQRLAANAYSLVSEKYDWATTLPRFLSLVERITHL